VITGPAIHRAAPYVQRQLDGASLTASHVALLVAHYQQARRLDVDGMPGPATVAALDQELARLRPKPLPKVWPLPRLADGRRPVVTSAFRSEDRPNHDGVDMFYRYDAGLDGPVEVGDGAAARGKDGKPKWFIPLGALVFACADGVVTQVGWTSTGYRVAVAHPDGWETRYYHLEDVRVQARQQVARGTALGLVGDNPRDIDATHLHLELTPAGVYAPVDPVPWLEGAEWL
jgi:murein DD-endopeptidase MepM/ murein hydrolase activator NlpD